MPQKMPSLPQPDAFSKAHSETVLHYILDLIAKAPQHRLTFAEFMQQVLYTPCVGYYAVGNRKFGKEGDFITAPEVSPLFSQCIAMQTKQVLEQLSEPVILEFGAGSGAMALVIMQTLAAENCLPAAYYILEISGALAQRQQQLIKEKAPELFPYFKWLTALPDKPINGVILANEVLDAMPVHRFHIAQQGIQEYYVVRVGNALSKSLGWSLGEPSSSILKNTIAELNLPDQVDYSSEINLIQPAWIHSLSDCLQQGLILLLDYGYPEAEYYHPQRSSGTLKCFFQQHQHEDPLILPGIQDITAHVNFTAIARAAATAGLEVVDFTSQGSFLLNCGIEQRVHKIQNQLDYINAVQQLKKLTLPTEMGELFKVMALSRKMELELLGFKHFSRLRYL